MEDGIIMAMVAVLIFAASFIAYIWARKEKKKFRIVNNEVYCPEAFHPLWYRIEQRYTFLFFIHWWGTPEFAPPHRFEKLSDAIMYIKEQCSNALVYDTILNLEWHTDKL